MSISPGYARQRQEWIEFTNEQSVRVWSFIRENPMRSEDICSLFDYSESEWQRITERLRDSESYRLIRQDRTVYWLATKNPPRFRHSTEFRIGRRADRIYVGVLPTTPHDSPCTEWPFGGNERVAA